jgi:RNA polymerase sigma-70 factor (ECF subfamily)
VDYQTLDDTTLVALMAHAQPNALNELYRRYNRLIFSLALNSLGDHASAEEVTLDVFTRAWEKAATYQVQQAKVTTWLVSITRNCAIDVLRQRQARLERDTRWAENSAPLVSNPEEAVELTLQRERVRAALAHLSAEQKQALALAYFQGYSHHQIAQTLAQPLGTVKTRIRSAMQKLRQILHDE